MDEQTNVSEVIEAESAPVEEVDEGLSDAEFNAIWDNDDDDMFAEQATEEEADQPTQEPDTTEETEPAETEQPDEPDTDQYLELKHFDEVRKVSKEEAKALAQKGMDYDRIRGKMEELKKYEDFLKEIQGDFASIDDLMDDTRARLKADKDNISYEDALKKVKEKPAKAAQTREEVLEQIRTESIQKFAQEHPEIKPEDIPEEVWKDVFKTNSLEASYAKYEAKKLKEEKAVLEKNAKNKSRSTGSMKSSGNSGLEKSEFERVMDSDDW